MYVVHVTAYAVDKELAIHTSNAGRLAIIADERRRRGASE